MFSVLLTLSKVCAPAFEGVVYGPQVSACCVKPFLSLTQRKAELT